MTEAFVGKPTVALPETRQLDVLAQLLERRNMAVVRCPLVSILDAPDAQPIVAWLHRFIEDSPELFVIYTGEGLHRLLGFAERAGLRDAFVAALGGVEILVRGPKPARALRALNIVPAHSAPEPTTAGLISALTTLGIHGKRIAVQFYGADENPDFIEFLNSRSITPDSVMPYIYAAGVEDEAVVELIKALISGRIDAIAFTSEAQVKRLMKVAAASALDGLLQSALGKTVVAAVGPVVANRLAAYGVDVDVIPESSFFMKPLVTKLVEKFSTK